MLLLLPACQLSLPLGEIKSNGAVIEKVLSLKSLVDGVLESNILILQVVELIFGTVHENVPVVIYKLLVTEIQLAPPSVV